MFYTLLILSFFTVRPFLCLAPFIFRPRISDASIRTFSIKNDEKRIFSFQNQDECVDNFILNRRCTLLCLSYVFSPRLSSRCFGSSVSCSFGFSRLFFVFMFFSHSLLFRVTKFRDYEQLNVQEERTKKMHFVFSASIKDTAYSGSGSSHSSSAQPQHEYAFFP